MSSGDELTASAGVDEDAEYSTGDYGLDDDLESEDDETSWDDDEAEAE